MRILIADGDELLLELMQSYLVRRGHEVETAVHGQDGIAALRAFVPNVLILDYDLLRGGRDGILAVLRNDPLLADVRVILIADTQTQFDAQADTNVVGWLRKPFQLSDLLLELPADAKGLQMADSTSVSRTHFTSGTGRDAPRPQQLQQLPRRLNPFRINTKYPRIIDRPR